MEIAANGQIADTVMDVLEFDGAEGKAPQIILISDDTFAVVYEGSFSDGFVSTLNIEAEAVVSNSGIFKANAYGISADVSNITAFINDQVITYPTPSDWAHVVLTYDKNIGTSQQKLYVNGALVATGILSEAINLNANDLFIGQNYIGSIDEVAVFNRVLNDVEVLDHYKRSGAIKLKLRVRSCNDAVCDDEVFTGYDGTDNTYYCELYNDTLGLPSLTLTNVETNRYFQYKAYMWTDNASYTPKLKNITIGPDHYCANNPTIVNATGQAYETISTFSDTLGGGNSGTINYQISNNGTNWYYWNGSIWVEESGGGYPTQTTDTATINANIAQFDDDIGAGNFFFKAFLNSNLGVTQIELDQVDIDYSIGSVTPPGTPSNVLPSDGALNESLKPVLSNTSFSHAPPSTHVASQWMIRTLLDSSYASPVYDSGIDLVNLTSVVIPVGSLSQNTTYYWKSRHMDSDNHWSEFSDETAFATGNTPVSLTAVGATEYTSGETARLTIQVKDTNGSAINAATATVDIYDPSSTKAVSAATMTYLSGSNGLYYYDYVTSPTLGVYIFDAQAEYNGETGYTSKTFHVAQFTSDITDIKADVTSILEDTNTTLQNQIDALEAQINADTAVIVSEINENEVKIDDLDSDVASASSSIVNLINVNTDNIIAEVDANEVKIDLLQSDITYIRSKLGSVFTDTQLIRSTANDILNKWGTTNAFSLSNMVDNLEVYIGTSTDSTSYLTLFGKINAIQEKWGASNAAAIYNIGNNAYNSIEATQNQLGYRGKPVSAYQNIQSIVTYTDALENELAILSGNLSSHEAAQAVSRTNVDDIGARTEDVQDRVVDVQTRTTDIQNKVNDIQANVDILVGAFIVTQSSVSDVSSTVNSFVTDLSNSTNDFYNNAVLTFTSGSLNGQNRRISNYDGVTKRVTLDPVLTGAPANADTFTIITQNVRTQEQIIIHEAAQSATRNTIDTINATTQDTQVKVTDIQSKANTLIGEIGTGNISGIKTKTDTIDWDDIVEVITTSGLIKDKTDTIDWATVTAIKTKTDTIDWVDITDIQTSATTLIGEIGTGNISAIKVSTDVIDWGDVTSVIATSGLIKDKTDLIDWADVTAIKTKTDTINWSDVTDIIAKVDNIQLTTNETYSLLSDVDTKINALDTSINNITTTLATVDGKIDALDIDIDSVLAKWGTSTAAELSSDISAVQTLVSAIRDSQQNGYTISLSENNNISASSTYRAKLTVLNSDNNPADALVTPVLTLYDSGRSIIESVDMTKLADGVYEYVYSVPSNAVPGLWESVVNVDVGGVNNVIRNDYWRVTANPTQVLINTITDTEISDISANATITNEGNTAFEYQYEYCIVSDINNDCGGGDDVDYAKAAKLIQPGDSFITDLNLNVSVVGDYWFKLVVDYGSDSSASIRSFTATERDQVSEDSGGMISSESSTIVAHDTSNLLTTRNNLNLDILFNKLKEVQAALGANGKMDKNYADISLIQEQLNSLP